MGKLRSYDYAEKHGYIRGVVKEIVHDPGRGAPVAKVQFRNAYRYQRDNERLLCTEGMYTGQFVYCGKKATLSVGNVLPLNMFQKVPLYVTWRQKLVTEVPLQEDLELSLLL